MRSAHLRRRPMIDLKGLLWHRKHRYPHISTWRYARRIVVGSAPTCRPKRTCYARFRTSRDPRRHIGIRGKQIRARRHELARSASSCTQGDNHSCLTVEENLASRRASTRLGRARSAPHRCGVCGFPSSRQAPEFSAVPLGGGSRCWPCARLMMDQAADARRRR